MEQEALPLLPITRAALTTRAALVLALFIVVLLVWALFFDARPAYAKTFTVTNTNVSGDGSLEQAITNANANNNNRTIDTIKFNIPPPTPGLA